ncbi:thyroid receptor-interacting protein 11-like [Uranotaenia lowii]|uniref:thyroid receptor-interacting protein 11-like n=1 Tax=Uranotaenia lowii TaxID=190385 RepID=UPI00247883CA|nr:thyroid receptor-interacting protein 11-like [Uranotaenia lowii]
MSWLKLNDSLNKVKGQITSFAQEVLAEGIVRENEDGEDDGQEQESEPANQVRDIGQAKQRISELTGLCATQDQEIATLRKQIAEYQQQLQNQSAVKHLPSPSPLPPPPAGESSTTGFKLGVDQHAVPSTSSSTASAAPAPVATLEDSWFWDPEQNVSSTTSTASSSSKKGDENDSPRSGGAPDLTTIPLEAPASEAEIIERLQRLVTDQRQQIKKQQLENALLGEKLIQVTGENKELNENIEELDRQHEMVVENLIETKKGLQDKIARLEEALRVKEGEATVGKELDELKKKYDKLEQCYTDSCQETVRLKAELERIVVENVDSVAGFETEIEDLKQTLQDFEQQSQKAMDTADQMINKLTAEKVDLDERLSTLKDENEQVLKNLSEMEDKNKLLEQAAKEHEIVQRELAELKRKSEEEEFVALQREGQSELEEALRRNQELIEEMERWKNDCDRLQEDNLNLQKLEKQLQSQLQEKNGIIANVNQQAPLAEESQLQIQQLQQEVGALQNELRSVIIDNSVQMDAKEKEWQEKLNFLKAENSRIQHSKDTLEADLIQYEKECSSLLKNNDHLLAELENLKLKKLETINENAEDSIVILEKQLEDCGLMNKSLEAEYREVNKKLEEVMEEREELETKVEQLKNDLVDKTNVIKNMKMTIENLEVEKSNLLFEINEAQSKDQHQEQNDVIESYKLETEKLKAQLTTINEDHASLVLKLKQLQQSSVENIKSLTTEISDARKQLETKESVIQQLKSDINSMKINQQASDEHKIKELQDRLEAESVQSYSLATEKDEALGKLTQLESVYNALKGEYDDHCRSCTQKIEELNQTVESLNQQKENLVQLITTKHNESVQYHAEIQRLNQLLQVELASKNEQQTPAECVECATLRERLSASESQAKKLEDYEKLTDQVQFLREKSDILTNNLLIEQNNQKLLQQEKLDIVEQRNSLEKDLQRLREHLMEIEEAHTTETVELQQKYTETRNKLQALEEEVKKSTNAMTSASIRANQHAETLQAQYQLLQQQRDELLAKLGAADDRDYKNQASLTNLQCALEQFQINKDRDIELATTAIRNELEQTNARENALKADIRQLQQQLADAKNGLLAAARISDQLEIAQVTVASLKDDLAKSTEKYATLENRLRLTEASQADKVEKSLVKNLVIGYVVAPHQNDKQQILKLISAVLTMDQTECNKVGLNRGTAGGWFNTILGGSAGTGTGGNAYNKESLSEAFVKFLEKESAPQSVNSSGSSLLNIMQSQQSTNSRTTTPTEQQQQHAPSTDRHSQAFSTNSNVPLQIPQPVMVRNDPQQQQQAPFPVQPILLGSESTISFPTPRSSSAILKDILSDS